MFHFSHFELYFVLHSCVLSTFQQHLLQFPTIIFICIYIHTHTHIYICIYTHTYIYIYIFAREEEKSHYLSTDLSICLYIYIYMYIYRYIYRYICVAHLECETRVTTLLFQNYIFAL